MIAPRASAELDLSQFTLDAGPSERITLTCRRCGLDLLTTGSSDIDLDDWVAEAQAHTCADLRPRQRCPICGEAMDDITAWASQTVLEYVCEQHGRQVPATT